VERNREWSVRAADGLDQGLGGFISLLPSDDDLAGVPQRKLKPAEQRREAGGTRSRLVTGPAGQRVGPVLKFGSPRQTGETE